MVPSSCSNANRAASNSGGSASRNATVRIGAETLPCKIASAESNREAVTASHAAASQVQKTASLPPYLEAVTGALKSLTKSVTSEYQKLHPYPHTPERLAKALRRPVVNLTGRGLLPELVS